MRFSQRIGRTSLEIPLQLDSINAALRNSIWNAIYLKYFQGMESGYGWQSGDVGIIAELSYTNFFKRPLDKLPEYGYQFFESLKSWFMAAKWYEVYDYVDWLGSHGAHWNAWRPGEISYDKAKEFREEINGILARENSGYRFIDAALAPISNKAEADEIGIALLHEGTFSAVTQHIEAALSLLANRSNPDYRNSIKESISAVEAAAKLVTGDKKATLGDALKTLEAETKLHGALKEGFSKLYGWTSNADGIRHSMMEASNLSVSDARFMLVACSAFANYLIERTSAE